MTFLYHYTSAECLNAIIAEKRVRRTPIPTASCAFFGPGVYLTTLGPDLGRTKLMANNRPGDNKNDAEAKTTHYISFPYGDLTGVKNLSKASLRNVYLFPGDIVLENIAFIRGVVTMP